MPISEKQWESRLAGELKRMQELREQSSFIDFVTANTPPDEYIVTFTCRGMVGLGRIGEEHVAKIYLHREFPYLPPKVTFVTPSFHPNIATLGQMAPIQRQIQARLRHAPDAEARRRVQQEIQEQMDLVTVRVCLDVLDLNWSPMITLDRICIELAEMIQYKHCNPLDALNLDAARWAVSNRHLLPVDARTILDRKAAAVLRSVEEEVVIRILEPLHG